MLLHEVPNELVRELAALTQVAPKASESVLLLVLHLPVPQWPALTAPNNVPSRPDAPLWGATSGRGQSNFLEFPKRQWTARQPNFGRHLLDG